jgi:hypothetical protein
LPSRACWFLRSAAAGADKLLPADKRPLGKRLAVEEDREEARDAAELNAAAPSRNKYRSA